VSIRPNPMNESATIALGNAGRYAVRVFDITGRVVAGFDNVQGDITLERNNMVSGMYYVNITDANGATKTLKVVVE
ncbi:MAG: T9SS type A sorting domain-containing protein, partial [Flavobacteriaceae bacterium]|nr:T9SS type A sorting domain-containing protein [Flavobacteriaceae bacterium]